MDDGSFTYSSPLTLKTEYSESEPECIVLSKMASSATSV